MMFIYNMLPEDHLPKVRLISDQLIEIHARPQIASGDFKDFAALRRVFPRIVFNKDTTEAGRAAIGWYHAKIDEKRDLDLGPEHDWSSHSADALGGMAVDIIDRPKGQANRTRKPVKRRLKGVA